MKKIFILVMLSVLSVVVSAQEASPLGGVNRLVSYSSSSGAFVSLSKNGSICSHGYHLEGDSPGFTANLSMLIAAYQTGTPVMLKGDVNALWKGSTHPVCRLISVEYKR